MTLAMRRLVAFAAVTTILTACAANPATGRQNFTLVGEQQEYQMGQQTAEQEIKSTGIYNGKPELTRYMEDIGRKMWAQTERAGTPVQVTLLDSDTFNAWAVPGYVSFYRGILPYFQNETQLAEVMGHEMGHINARHSAQNLTRGMLGSLALTAGGILIGATTDNDVFANMVTTVGSVGVGLGLTAYGRADELEADRLALRYMGKAGYEAREAYNSHRTFELYEAYANQQFAALNDGKLPPKGFLADLTSTHPRTPDRAQQVQTLVGLPDGSLKLPQGVTPATPADDPFGRTRYLRAIDGLAFGPKPEYGIGGKNVVYFPTQQFVWQLPDSSAGGFVTDVTVKDKNTFAWKAVNPQAGVKASLTFEPLPAGLNPAQKLNGTFASLNPQDKWQAIQMGNQSGWTFSTQAPSNPNLLVRVIGVAIPDKNLMAVLHYQIPKEQAAADGAIVKAAQSGGVVSAATARTYQPLKVRIKTSAGESVASMAAKLPSGALQEMWFRALNGLQPGQSLPAGTLYKTVVDENR